MCAPFLASNPQSTYANTAPPARAVRKANKELAELVSGREDHLAKVDAIQTKYSELLHEMKRLERDHAKARKRADQLQKEKDHSRSEMQKEKDHSRSEMQKAVTIKHKLETLCRELQKENKRIKVYIYLSVCHIFHSQRPSGPPFKGGAEGSGTGVQTLRLLISRTHRTRARTNKPSVKNSPINSRRRSSGSSRGWKRNPTATAAAKST